MSFTSDFAATPAIIECRQLTGHYAVASKPLLNNLNLSLMRGSISVIYGNTGVGKTLFLRFLAGHLTPTRGDACILGEKLYQLPAHVKPFMTRRVVSCFEDSVLSGQHSALSQILLPVVQSSEEAQHQAMQWCAQHDIDPHTPLRYLSSAQQKIVLILQALMKKPMVLLIDNLLSTLDLERQNALLAQLNALCQLGSCVLLTAAQPYAACGIQMGAYILNGGALHQMTPVFRSSPLETTC